MNASQRGKRNRRHGHDTERMVVAYLRAHGWADACTTRSKLGHDGAHAPGDIITLLTLAGCAPPPDGPATCPPERCIVQVTP